MKKGNVLVIGNSGVGKSTLINAVLGDEVAKTSWGESGTTSKLDIYEGEPFNVIDTIGFEPSLFKSNKAISAVKKWSKKSAKEENNDKQINVIWFCVDGTSRKLFPKAIKDLSKAISMWKSVPIIAVITKSYSVPERSENIELVKNVFSKNKELSKKLRGIIPVVAQTYVLNDIASAPPEGITELIELTNNLMPEGFKAAKKDINRFNLNRKRAMAQSSILGFVATAVAKTFINIGASDSIVLATIENTMVDTLGKIYNIDPNSKEMSFIKNNINNGTVNKIAKAAIVAIEKLPIGQKVGSAIINPIIAASVVLIIGESSSITFEKVYLGDTESINIDKIKEFFESEMINKIIDYVKSIGESLSPSSSSKDIIQSATDLFKKNNKINQTNTNTEN